MQTKVTIQTSTTREKDDEGHHERIWEDAGQLDGFLLPVGNEYALQKYGISEDVQYQFIYKGSSALLKTGNRIMAAGKPPLYIIYPADYLGRAVDVMLSSTITSNLK